MNASINGCLKNLNKSYRMFTHNDKTLSKETVKFILEYGLKKGYDSTNDFSDDEIDKLLKQLEE